MTIVSPQLSILSDGSFHLEGIKTQDRSDVRKILETFKGKMEEESFSCALFFLGVQNQVLFKKMPTIHFWHRFSQTFIHRLRLTPDIEILRDKATIEFPKQERKQFLLDTPNNLGSEYIQETFLTTIWEELNDYFKRQIRKTNKTVESFLHALNEDIHSSGRIYFHLVENKNSRSHPFSFLATSKVGKNDQHVPLREIIKETSGNEDKLRNMFIQLYRAVKKSSSLDTMFSNGDLFHPIQWTPQEAFRFLKEIPAFENAGILCHIPDWWRKKRNLVSTQISLGEKQVSHLGMNALINFNLSFHLQSLNLSYSETAKLLEHEEGLFKIKNHWIVVDHEKIKQALGAWDGVQQDFEDGINFSDAMRMLLSKERGQKSDLQTANVLNISFGKWLSRQLNILESPQLAKDLNPSKKFLGKLRPYQRDGLKWMSTLRQLSFSGCLADDMGLGKTVQVLAYLDTLEQKKFPLPTLLIVPASLLANWMSEIKKFSPHLNYSVIHPQFQQQNQSKIKKNIFMTTYQMIQKEKWLHKKEWGHIILDEAQAIKNPNTKQSKTIKALKSNYRLALTGTPIENRLFDLWSLFDFLNPGLLGNRSEFKQITKRLENGQASFANLNKVVRPYILRRLKTDPLVISDLPPKVEMKNYTMLSPKQIVLYKKVVEELKESLTEVEGIKRKGLILATLMKLKQICNHSDHFLGHGRYLEKNSGKFQKLKELCEIILSKGERVLIFTQFQEITRPLAGFLQDSFTHTPLILTGRTQVKNERISLKNFKARNIIPFSFYP